MDTYAGGTDIGTRRLVALHPGEAVVFGSLVVNWEDVDILNCLFGLFTAEYTSVEG